MRWWRCVGGEFLEGGGELVGEDAEEELVVDDDHGSANKVGVAGGGFLECLVEFAACDEPFGPGGEFRGERGGVERGGVNLGHRCSSADGGFADCFR